MNLGTKITIYKFTPQVFTLTRNLLNLCTKLPDKGEEVKHAKGKSLEMFHNLLFKIRFHR
jgi:hypothetical protein